MEFLKNPKFIISAFALAIVAGAIFFVYKIKQKKSNSARIYSEEISYDSKPENSDSNSNATPQAAPPLSVGNVSQSAILPTPIIPQKIADGEFYPVTKPVAENPSPIVKEPTPPAPPVEYAGTHATSVELPIDSAPAKLINPELDTNPTIDPGTFSDPISLEVGSFFSGMNDKSNN